MIYYIYDYTCSYSNLYIYIYVYIDFYICVYIYKWQDEIYFMRIHIWCLFIINSMYDIFSLIWLSYIHTGCSIQKNKIHSKIHSEIPSKPANIEIQITSLYMGKCGDWNAIWKQSPARVQQNLINHHI